MRCLMWAQIIGLKAWFYLLLPVGDAIARVQVPLQHLCSGAQVECLMNVCVVGPALPSDGVYDTVTVLQLVAEVAVSAQVGAEVGQTPPFCQSKQQTEVPLFYS